MAKLLYIRGYTVLEISRETKVPSKSIYNWRDDGDWDNFCPPDTVEIALARRVNILSQREKKTPEELDELDRLITNMAHLSVQLATAKRIQAESESIGRGVFPPAFKDFTEDLAKPPREKTARKKDKAVKNDISGVTTEALDAVRIKLFYGYQLLWYAMKTMRNRFILKSRQIGATYYFAFEALDDAIRTGDNQLFLSASRDQAEVFKAYIIAFAKEHFDVELKGQTSIILSNGAELRFLSTNSNTAQSYHGHLYTDEVFWINNYVRLRKVSSGMAAHKKWRRTDFSTPSAISHPAYAFWSGEVYNRHRVGKHRRDFDISHDGLKDGWLGPDNIWRHMVTVEDAEVQGCDLFDIEGLKLEYTADDFNNLFMCKFIDDSQSVFNLAMMLECTVENDVWKDYHEQKTRPFGNKEVSLGYDPSRVRDNASLGILAVPTPGDNFFRALTTKNYHGQNFQYQANRIKEVVDSHNVVHIGIDTTGIGHGVFELVESFYPLVTPINYSVETKTRLVVKAIDVISNGRFKYLLSNSEITRAFMMITRTTTTNGSITYASGRSEQSGHADVAWSIMHAMIYEPINHNRPMTTVS